MSVPSDSNEVSTSSSSVDGDDTLTDGLSAESRQEVAHRSTNLTIAEEMQEFCNIMYTTCVGLHTEESWCNAIQQCIDDRSSCFSLGYSTRRQTSGPSQPPEQTKAFRLVTKARIETEHKRIALYFVISLHLPHFPVLPPNAASIDDRVEYEYQQFVALIRSHCRTALAHLSEDEVFGFGCPPSLFPRLVKFQPTSRYSAGYFEDPSSYWTGTQFYTDLYRKVNASQCIMYEVFGIMHAISGAVFALEIVAMMEQLTMEEDGEGSDGEDGWDGEYKGE